MRSSSKSLKSIQRSHVLFFSLIVLGVKLHGAAWKSHFACLGGDSRRHPEWQSLDSTPHSQALHSIIISASISSPMTCPHINNMDMDRSQSQVTLTSNPHSASVTSLCSFPPSESVKLSLSKFKHFGRLPNWSSTANMGICSTEIPCHRCRSWGDEQRPDHQLWTTGLSVCVSGVSSSIGRVGNLTSIKKSSMSPCHWFYTNAFSILNQSSRILIHPSHDYIQLKQSCDPV